MNFRMLNAFYSGHDDEEKTLFQLWEQGGARGDSVTPSTYSAPYRGWMRDRILEALRRNGTGGLVSLGCGNAVIEEEIAALGHEVLAVDLLPEAVACARNKGLRAVQADISAWTPPEGGWTVVYMDGVLPHLYDPGRDSLPVLAHIRSWLGEGTLIASNDGTRDGSPVERVPNIPDFHWLSPEYMREEARSAGFVRVSSTTFTYERPLSGPRRRSVLFADAVH
ncbi:class I SAM-dependent DNA methyltransferase [Streptomyces sp. NPDC053048]|uniref:class I SAM-dependent DNA methyltransferase n=1 Tax=Streptomyces sp. NPDC053048 TaxID=3365694 RepID=UPI0037D8BE2D